MKEGPPAPIQNETFPTEPTADQITRRQFFKVVFERAKKISTSAVPETTELNAHDVFSAEISRRKLIGAGVTGFLALTLGINRRFRAPKLEEQPLTFAQVEEQFNVDYHAFFVKERKLKRRHRSGNTIKDIDHALIEEDANVFDIDANDVGGKIYGEHGIIPNINIGPLNLKFPIVFDYDEMELSTKMPATISDLIRHIHYLSTPENPLAVSIQLKRGKFNEKTLEGLLNTLEKYDVPAVFLSSKHDKKLYKIIEKRRNTI